MISQVLKPYVIGLDLGGTNSVFGIVDSRGDIKATTAIKTQSYANVDDYVNASIDALQIIIDQVGGIDKIKAMGIGAPNANYYKGTIEYAPNIAWGHECCVPLAEMFNWRNDIRSSTRHEELYNVDTWHRGWFRHCRKRPTCLRKRRLCRRTWTCHNASRKRKVMRMRTYWLP